MKKWAVVMFLAAMLAGCAGKPKEMERGLNLRSRLLQAEGCAFQAHIEADYGDQIQRFSLSCQADSKGNLTFTVLKPDTIAGITGSLSGEGGSLTFDDTALHFELLAEEQLSPISAPWILLKTLRSGYITSCCSEEEGIRLTIDDSYEDDALTLDIRLDQQDLPTRAEILYEGRKILSVSVEGFAIL